MIDYLVYYHISDLLLSFNKISEFSREIVQEKLKEWISTYGLPRKGVEKSYFFSTLSSSPSLTPSVDMSFRGRRGKKEMQIGRTRFPNSLPQYRNTSQSSHRNQRLPPTNAISSSSFVSSSSSSSTSTSTSSSSQPAPLPPLKSADRRKFQCQIPIRFFSLLLRLCGPLSSLIVSDLVLLLFYSLLEPKYERQFVLMKRLRGRGKKLDALIPFVENEKELFRRRVEILKGDELCT